MSSCDGVATPKRVLVCGGRDFGEMPRWAQFGTFAYIEQRKRVNAEIALLDQTLSALPRPAIIIHGAAKGADRLAKAWAKRNGIDERAFPANWYPNGFGKIDKSAGPRRNQQMIDEGKPDLIVAFPGGTGTADMVRRARSAGIDVMEVKP